MAYNTADPRAEYTATGSPDFDFVFKIFLSSDIKVYLTPVGETPNDVDDSLTLDVDYSVAINGDNGGTITVTPTPTNGDTIVIVRDLPVKRDVDYQQGGDLDEEVLDADQEYQTYLIADGQTLNDRFIKLPDTAVGVSTQLPAVIPDGYFKWSADGTKIEIDDTVPQGVVDSSDNVFEAGSWANENEDIPVKEYTVGVPSDRSPTVYSSKHHALKSSESASSSQLKAWEAQAQTLTAESFAVQSEDVNVLIFTSNGDGTFTATPSSEFSSFHWSKKAELFNPSLYALLTGATFTGQVKGITPVNDEDLVRKDYVDGSILNKVGSDFLAKVKTNQVTQNIIFGGYKGISILGDSITHGAFALNSFNNSWARIFQKMANVELRSDSYGVINFLTLGSGSTTTTDIHSVNFTGSWSGSTNGLETLMGVALSNGAVNDEINVSIPKFQSNGMLNYIQSPTGGIFELYVNGVLDNTIDTSGTLNPYMTEEFPLTDGGKGTTEIKMKVISGTVELSTIAYYQGVDRWVNLFASSGRKLQEVTDNTIDVVCENSSTLIMALGHNDTYSVDLVSRIDKLIAKCNSEYIQLVIPDFRWNLGVNDSVRQELIRLHKSVPNSIYIPFPERFKNDGTTVDGDYTVTTLDLFTDASHPNVVGHKLIAETIAKEMKLSVTSKDIAIGSYNFKMPLTLNSGTTVENIAVTSTVKWDNLNVTINCFIRMAAGGAFPTGTHVVQTSWNPKYEVPNIRQTWQGVAYIRSDTGQIISVASLSGSGELRLYVLAPFITNQSFAFSAPVN